MVSLTNLKLAIDIFLGQNISASCLQLKIIFFALVPISQTHELWLHSQKSLLWTKSDLDLEEMSSTKLFFFWPEI